MDLYLFCLGLSFSGLVLMALLGFGHHHAGHGHAAHHGHGHGHGGKCSAHKHGGHSGCTRANAAMMALGFLSPRLLFSVLLGFGATGLLARSLLAPPAVLLAVLAMVGGLAFEKFIVGPFWNLLFGFASKPARTLDTVRFEAGKAVTDFDRAGHGLVLLELDGQVRQVLGTLTPEERASDAPRVRTGERLFIHSVDGRRNACTVSRLGC